MFSYAVWLMPCAEQRAELDSVIRDLSFRFSTPAFAPHVTLCSGVWKKSEAELIHAVDCLADGPPVTMTADRIDWTDHWSTFFFLRLKGEESLFERAVAVIIDSHPPVIGPHLSLMYGIEANDVDRNAIRAALDVPPSILLDTLAVVCPEAGHWQDVDAWKILHVANG